MRGVFAPTSPSPQPSPARGEGEKPSATGPLPPPWGRAREGGHGLADIFLMQFDNKMLYGASHTVDKS